MKNRNIVIEVPEKCFKNEYSVCRFLIFSTDGFGTNIVPRCSFFGERLGDSAVSAFQFKQEDWIEEVRPCRECLKATVLKFQKGE